MLTILAIESSGETASAAILLNGKIIVRHAPPGAQQHSQHILPMVQEILQQADVALRECDAVAFGAGPGSFTGVRTACGVAQGLAFGAGLPVVPVVTLQAMAQRCRDATGASDVLAVLDARMGEVYWAQYRYDDAWKVVAPPALSKATDVAPLGKAMACGNGLSAYPEVFNGMFQPGERHDAMPGAAEIARLAAIEFIQGRMVAAHDAQPLYLRNKVALTTAERAAKETS